MISINQFYFIIKFLCNIEILHTTPYDLIYKDAIIKKEFIEKINEIKNLELFSRLEIELDDQKIYSCKNEINKLVNKYPIVFTSLKKLFYKDLKIEFINNYFDYKDSLFDLILNSKTKNIYDQIKIEEDLLEKSELEIRNLIFGINRINSEENYYKSKYSDLEDEYDEDEYNEYEYDDDDDDDDDDDIKEVENKNKKNWYDQVSPKYCRMCQMSPCHCSDPF